MSAERVWLSLAMLASICFGQGVLAEDWPHWMGAGHDGVWNESGIISSFPDGGADVQWRKPIGGGYGGPAIVGNHVFIMERTKDERQGIDVENDIAKAGEIAGGERVKCLDLMTGELVWEYSYDSAYRIAYPNGPRCTPAVDGDRVYSLGAMGKLLCLNSKTGKVVWQTDLIDQYKAKPPLWGYSSHPLIDGKKLIVPVGGKGSGVVAFDKLTGKEIWRAVDTFDIAYAPLVIYSADIEGKPERQLISWHAVGVTSLNPETGEEFWNLKFPEERNPSQTQIATPRLAGNKLLISEFYKGSLLLEIGSNPPSVKEIWRSYKDDPRSQKSLNCMMATPFVKQGFAYGVAFNRRGEGVLRCVELESNDLKWETDDWQAKKPLMFGTAFLVENGERYFLFSDTGDLIVAELSPEGYQELGRAKILDPTTPARGRKVVWCHPAFAAGKMVVRNDEEIVCVNLQAVKKTKP